MCIALLHAYFYFITKPRLELDQINIISNEFTTYMSCLSLSIWWNIKGSRAKALDFMKLELSTVKT